MQRIIILFTLFLQCTWVYSNTEIFGSVEKSKSEWVYLYEIDDFLTRSETLVQKFKTNSQGRFYFNLDHHQTKRYVIRINNTFTELYLQPDSEYKIIIPSESIEVIPYFSGREIELLFIDLDTNDINYKILGFEAWLDDEMADLYLLKDADPTKFIDGVLKFKVDVFKTYKEDTSSFFVNHIKYVLGKTIDNIKYFGSPSEAEKFDFYIKGQKIQYQLPAYFDYFKDYYQGVAQKLNPTAKKIISKGLSNGNASQLAQGLMTDSLIPNLQIAELVGLLIIAEEYPKANISQNQLISITKFLEKNSGFEENKILARNLSKKFFTLVSGDALPPIPLNKDSDLGKLGSFQYVHFFDPDNPKSLAESRALKSLYEKYGSQIDFVSICLDSHREDETFKDRVLKNIEWPVYSLPYHHPIWKALNIGTFPYYILIDPTLIIQSMPALGPTPNGLYKTIAKTFFDIVK